MLVVPGNPRTEAAPPEIAVTQSAHPAPRSQCSSGQKFKNLVRIELCLRTLRESNSSPGGIHVELVKGKSPVAGGLVLAGARADNDGSNVATVAVIPPAAFDNDWSLKIRKPDPYGWFFQIERVKGYFEDGTSTTLYGRSPEIGEHLTEKNEYVFPLRRS
jgi:hypothetical protein